MLSLHDALPIKIRQPFVQRPDIEVFLDPSPAATPHGGPLIRTIDSFSNSTGQRGNVPFRNKPSGPALDHAFG